MCHWLGMLAYLDKDYPLLYVTTVARAYRYERHGQHVPSVLDHVDWDGKFLLKQNQFIGLPYDLRFAMWA